MTPKEISPLFLIDSLRQSDIYIEHLFLNGSCYQFCLFLKKIFPATLIYIKDSKDHVASNINGILYDIRGVLPESEWCLYDPINEFEEIEAEKWSFNKQNCLQLNECPACEEPLIFNINDL